MTGAVVDLEDSLFRRAHEAEDRGHYDMAIDLFLRLARMPKHGVSAMNRLATLYDDRLRQPQRAIYWYLRGVRAGDDMAAWNLAMHYIPRGNRRWYRFWMIKAEALGHEDAVKEMTKVRADLNYMTKLPLEDEDDD